MISKREFAAVILAAGKGTRMKSDRHKVLHPIGGRAMIDHLFAILAELAPARKLVILGSGRDQVEPLVEARGGEVVVQDSQLGTAHAVLQAEARLTGFEGDVLILFGDTPLIEAETLARMIDRLNSPDRPGIVVAGFRPDDPGHYGRIITGSGDMIEQMVEYKDATAQERTVDLCNSGLMAVRSAELFDWLHQVDNANIAGEYYLPDIVMIAASRGRPSVVIEADSWEMAGVNDRAELARVEAEWQRRRRAKVMAEGVSLIAPETVWFAFDTRIGRDTLIEPNVVFGPGVDIGERVIIRSFSHVEGARLADESEIGPFARLRPGAEIGQRAKIGNFVEVKKSRLGEGAKANHLAYLGDSDIGAGANIGAGTITCNYDGYFKHHTHIGEGAFIGSNSALVAPVSIGKGAMIGAGSVIIRDVAEDSIAIARGEQVEKEGRARRFRETMAARKAKK